MNEYVLKRHDKCVKLVGLETLNHEKRLRGFDSTA